MNLLKKLLPEFTYNELLERIIEEEIYLRLKPTMGSTIKKQDEKDLKMLLNELDRRNIKKIRKQKLEKINEI